MPAHIGINAGRLPDGERGYRAHRMISGSRLAASSIRPRRVLGDTGPNGARVRSEAMMPPSAGRITLRAQAALAVLEMNEREQVFPGAHGVGPRSPEA